LLSQDKAADRGRMGNDEEVNIVNCDYGRTDGKEKLMREMRK
jgi:hypothetical protein